MQRLIGLPVLTLALTLAASIRVPPIVVTASMTERLAELAGVPLDARVVYVLPAVAQRVLPEPDRVEAAPRTLRISVAPVADTVPTEDVVSPLPVGEEPMPAVVATDLPGVVPLALQIGLPSHAGVSVVSSLTLDAKDSTALARARRAPARRLAMRTCEQGSRSHGHSGVVAGLWQISSEPFWPACADSARVCLAFPMFSTGSCVRTRRRMLCLLQES